MSKRRDLQRGRKVYSYNRPSPRFSATVDEQYVTDAINKLDWKQSVKLASAVGGNVSDLTAVPLTIDGVVVTAGDRVLLKNQTTASENGIYTYSALGLVRAPDGEQDFLTSGAAVFVEDGDTNDTTMWYLATNDPITVGSTLQVWAQFYPWGTLSGSIFTVLGPSYAKTTSSVSFDADDRYTTAIGSDVFFFVSGSKNGSDKSVFGGNAVVSGSLTALQGVSGSLTQLIDGTSYLIAGGGVTITSASNGAVTISSVGGSPGGSDTEIQYNGSGAFTGSNNFTFNGASLNLTGSFHTSGSVTQGPGTFATGEDSFAHGLGDPNNYGDLTASGNYSHAEGESTTASGIASHSEGQATTASGDYSHAEGFITTASAQYSHAEGSGTTAGGFCSHAEGVGTTTSANFTHAEGNSSSATQEYAHAEGVQTTASGYGSHSEGDNTTASGDRSHAEGYYSIATGQYSHAEGEYTEAIGQSSHAEGHYTIASGSYQHAGGMYNVRGNDFSLFVIGNGTSDADVDRSDVLRVNSGSIGDGRVEVTGSLAATMGLSGSLTQLTDGTSYLIAGTNITITSASNGSVTIDSTSSPGGSDTNIQYNSGGSFAGSNNFTYNGSSVYLTGSLSNGSGAVASGTQSHAEGFNTTASNNWSHAEGRSTTASGAASHAEGNGTTASGNYSHAEGTGGNLASGEASHAEGFGAIASGSYSHAEGESTIALGDVSHAEGIGTIASGSYQHVGGKYNVRGNDFSLFVVGNGTSDADVDRSDVLRVNSGSVGNGRVEVTGSLAVTMGLSGSLTRLADGTSYLIAGTNITIASASNGSVTINSTASGGGGNDFFESTTAGSIFTTGSVAFIDGEPSVDSPLDKGSDVFFYVSGSGGAKNSATSGVALFGGDVVISGTLHGGSPLKIGTDTQVTGSLDVSGSLSIGGEAIFSGDVIEMTGSLSVTQGISGSLTRLTDGTSYLIAGSGITIASQSNGPVTISSTGVTAAAGNNSEIQYNSGGAFAASPNLTFNGTTLAVTGNATISGDLTINGSTTTVNTVNLEVKDSVIGLGFTSGTVSAVNGDRGWIGSNTTGGVDTHVLSKWDNANSEFAFARTTSSATGSLPVVITSYSNLHVANLQASIVTASLGFSGSLTQLVDGTSYLVAGSNITIVSASNGSVTISSTASGGGGGDPAAEYLVLSTTGSLSGERALTMGTGLESIDGGAGGNYTIGIDDSIVATVSGTTFTGATKHNAGLSGSLTRLTDGSSYLIASGAVQITTGANGSVTVFTPENSGQVFAKGYVLGNAQDGFGNIDLSSIGSLVPGYDDESDIDVYLNGQLLAYPGDYAMDSSTVLHVSSTLSSNDVLTVRMLVTSSLMAPGYYSPGGSSTHVQFNDGGNFGGDSAFTFNKSTKVVTTHSVLPAADVTYNLGGPSNRWSNVYTGDLHLKNDRGDWTIVEEEDYLCVVNNKTGKRYKMNLTPLD
jgi:hypothetical protein